jgi:PAS domain S-box-containing protein
MKSQPTEDLFASHHRPIVLVCDDDEDMLKLIRHALSHQSFRVIDATTGKKALELCQKKRPDLVLLDAHMPGMDGFCVCEEIRKLSWMSTVPVIMVTAFDDKDSVNRAFAAGAEEFIAKPINWAVLINRMHALVKRSHDETVIRLFMRYTPAAVAMFDMEMHYLHASHRWLDHYNLADQDVTGQSHNTLVPDQPGKWMEIYQRCLQGAWEKNDADPFEDKDGNTRWFRWECFPWTRTTGETGGIVVFTEDVTGQQCMANEVRKHRDKLAFERELVEDVITRMRVTKLFDPYRIRFLQDPVEKTAGDILLSALRPDGTQHIMIGDFTGHGLPAAIGGPITSDIFYTMTSKGFSLVDIMEEINIRLYEKTPANLFLATGFLELNPARTRLTVRNRGIPDVLLVRNGCLHARIPSGDLALGLVNWYDPTGKIFDIEPGDRIFAYTDGFIEEHNDAGEMFGQDNFERLLLQVLDLDEPLELMQRALRGYREGHEQSDDMTMVELTC